MEAGRELDALIAEKVMGILKPTVAGTKFPVGAFPTAEVHIPNYSTDIAAAWEVLDRELGMREQYDIDAEDYIPKPFKISAVLKIDGGLWMARWDNPVNSNEMPGYYERSCYPDKAEFVVADTAPLAICLAALKAVGVNV